jgi:ornithine cyclodeaminase/alanine dehydrogenase-like protein (mu-crystallin family)
MSELKLLYLSYADIASLQVSMQEIIDALAPAFLEHACLRVEMPPKPGIHTQPDAFIHAMPAYIPALHSAGVKWVSGYPDNAARGLPYISGLLILNDVETGIPLCVMDCTWITAMRTGAATALSARHLAAKDCRVVGILGCGVQGCHNLEALNVIYSLERVFAYDTDSQRLDAFADQMTGKLGLEVVKARQSREAVESADIVVTCGPILLRPHATIKAGWLKEGAFASLVDFDSYFDGAALQEVDKFCTDDIPQLEHYRQLGYFQNIPPIYASLGELVAGLKAGRENDRERTIACNLGLALADMATAPIVYKRALERGVGTLLPL